MTDFPALKRHTSQLLNSLTHSVAIQDIYHPDATLRASHPVNEITGHDAIGNFWEQIKTALPDLERRDQIFVAGACKPDSRASENLSDKPLIATMGHYQGTFQKDLFDIPATQGVVNLRSCEVHYIQDGKIAETTILLDFLDLMRQTNVWPVAPSLGQEGLWPGPASSDGVLLDQYHEEEGNAAFDVVMAMHHALLHTFDGRSVTSMKHDQYWTDHFQWYGPSGIGTTRGMAGFRAHHQIPFLTGFPDRSGGSHYVRIAEGNYVVTGGWPSVVGTHLGEWLGLPPTGKRINMRVMDFYRLENGLIAENWVPIDIIHILLQMGVDVFARLRHMRGSPKLDL